MDFMWFFYSFKCRARVCCVVVRKLGPPFPECVLCVCTVRELASFCVGGFHANEPRHITECVICVYDVFVSVCTSSDRIYLFLSRHLSGSVWVWNVPLYVWEPRAFHEIYRFLYENSPSHSCYFYCYSSRFAFSHLVISNEVLLICY